MDKPRQKVAIIGGGVSGIATAMELSNPALPVSFDITVYTMGWRLGGKCASGRNTDDHQRIEEHGLHIWFGFYDNAINMMRETYEELGRPKGAPLATFDEAFKPQNFFLFNEKILDTWRSWPITMPINAYPPGGKPHLLAAVEIMLKWVAELLGGLVGKLLHVVEEEVHHLDYHKLITQIRGLGHHILHDGKFILHTVLHGLAELISDLSTEAEHDTSDHVGLLGDIATALWDLIGDKVRAGDDDYRRLWIFAYLGITVTRGVLSEDLFRKGLDAANDKTFHQFLKAYAVLDDDILGDPNGVAFYSAPVRAFFDACFAYHGGETDQPDMAAGTTIRGMQLIAISYNGACVYEMQAGMGDTVFTPFYKVLKERGVNFEFFSKAQEINLDASGDTVEEVLIHQQVALHDTYDPLVEVKGLACWPSRPLFDQIVDGEALQASGANLELYSNGWPGLKEPKRLRLGQDFDKIVLASPLPCLPKICPDIILEKNWTGMVNGISNVRTQAAQVWMTKTRHEIGLPTTPAIIGSFVEPWSSITDFTHLIEMEDWPSELDVSFLTYSCGVMPETDTSVQKDADALVLKGLKAFLSTGTQPIWPNLTQSGGTFEWSALLAPDGVNGDDRVNYQYWRANIDPTQVYILSCGGEVKNRRKSEDTGVSNLVFAGDWTDTLIDIGCVEAAVISGIFAARAISGADLTIVNEELLSK